ncbi:MAG: AcrB/AcrD/AcrF family protein [Pseudomonadota bacterium]|nr:AcrB/AcrD/AcrF family protein [Pseudomonadota bacterium]
MHPPSTAIEWAIRYWRPLLLLFWLAAAALMLFDRWGAVQWFALGDTDDNLRMMQVRALLSGQDWYDLRQYRLNPPTGADIHWSRFVDLPIAGIKLALAPLIGGAAAERWAVALAPLLPMGVAVAAVAVTARRLISPAAFALAVGLLFCAHSARGMWAPLRIDHHGWQLALLAVTVMAMVDPKRARGGAILGFATALSLSIGLEMLPYLALAGAVTVLIWVWDGAEARRLAAYGASLAGGCALFFLIFASYANRAPLCDALSPVWLSALLPAGALCVALAAWSPERRLLRLAAAAMGGALIAAAFAWMWPDCLGRLEQSSPELERLWLSKVREAMPIYRHGWKTAATGASLPVIGLIGYAAMVWRHRREPEALIRWAGLGLLALAAAALLLWQTRATPAAQLLAIPGATALAWLILGWIRARPNWILRAATVVVAFLLISGLATFYVTRLVPDPPASERRRAIAQANSRCPTIPALRPIALQPRGTVLTFVDLGPRLITVTHHDAITGPYHRNARQIIDVMRAWRGDAENARRTVERYDADYLLICPNLSESTIYRSEAPRGFYMQLVEGKVPDWLEPVELPGDSPYRMWRVRGRSPG